MRDAPPDAPRDELRVRFSREPLNQDDAAADDDDAPRGSAESQKRAQNEELLQEIRSMMPPPPPPKPESQPVDLNGIKPTDLLIGAGSYLVVAVLAWQFTSAAGEYFAERDINTDAYFVARLTSLVRTIVIGMGALGAGITTIAGLGQLVLAIDVSRRIAAGELDPSAERKFSDGGRKVGETERLFRMMRGGDKRVS